MSATCVYLTGSVRVHTFAGLVRWVGMFAQHESIAFCLLMREGSKVAWIWDDATLLSLFCTHRHFLCSFGPLIELSLVLFCTFGLKITLIFQINSIVIARFNHLWLPILWAHVIPKVFTPSQNSVSLLNCAQHQQLGIHCKQWSRLCKQTCRLSLTIGCRLAQNWRKDSCSTSAHCTLPQMSVVFSLRSITFLSPLGSMSSLDVSVFDFAGLVCVRAIAPCVIPFLVVGGLLLAYTLL